MSISKHLGYDLSMRRSPATIHLPAEARGFLFAEFRAKDPLSFISIAELLAKHFQVIMTPDELQAYYAYTVHKVILSP